MRYSVYKNKIFNVCITLNVLFIFSCSNDLNCGFLTQKAADNECIIIVNKLPSSPSPTLDAKGINPITKEEFKCSDGGRWWTQFEDEISTGDTIIKRKGELTFNIHKKDTIISHEWVCEGKTYTVNDLKKIKSN